MSNIQSVQQITVSSLLMGPAIYCIKLLSRGGWGGMGCLHCGRDRWQLDLQLQCTYIIMLLVSESHSCKLVLFVYYLFQFYKINIVYINYLGNPCLSLLSVVSSNLAHGVLDTTFCGKKDTKRVVRSRKSKDQMAKKKIRTKGQITMYKTLYRKLKVCQ